MKKTILGIFGCITLLAACKSDSPKSENKTAEVVTPKVEKIDTSCYQYTFKQDVTMAKIITKGDSIFGDYHWHPYEKDGAHGTLRGTIKDSIITATYDYMIEGSNQTEKKVFKISANRMLEAEYDYDEKKQELVLKMPISFNEKEALIKTDCKTLKFDSED